MYVVAIDIGYGNLKRAAGQGISPPDVHVWPACALPLARAGKNLLGPERRADVVLDGEPWLVGVDPDSGASSVEILHREYVNSPPWRAQMLFALSHGLRQPRRGLQRPTRINERSIESLCGPDTSDTLVGDAIDRLVLGLPVDEWLDEDLRQRPVDAARQLAREAGLDVGDVLVVPQPLGAYVDTNLRCGGELIRRRTLVVDPGQNTLDWSLFDHGQLLKHGTGTAREGGVARIVEGVRTRLREQYGARVGEGRIRAGLKNGGRLLVRGRERDCSDVIAAVQAEVVDEATALMLRSLQLERDDIDDVVLTGGGACYYREALAGLFPHARVHEGDDAVQTNVRGFWHFAVHRHG